ncbi:MAG: hypothetical protein J6D03_00155 [Clostridia bacterium]|nr:hypothetical protein [Clostridia bacterium]
MNDKVTELIASVDNALIALEKAKKNYDKFRISLNKKIMPCVSCTCCNINICRECKDIKRYNEYIKENPITKEEKQILDKIDELKYYIYNNIDLSNCTASC